MKLRIWRTEVIEDRIGEYEAFARDVSLPMFQQQPGYLGLVMGGDRDDRCVVTYWADDAAIAALDHSPSYKATVARIMAAGFLKGTQSVDVYDAHMIDGIAGSVRDSR